MDNIISLSEALPSIHSLKPSNYQPIHGIKYHFITLKTHFPILLPFSCFFFHCTGPKGEPGTTIAEKGLPGPRGQDGEPGLPGVPGTPLFYIR